MTQRSARLSLRTASQSYSRIHFGGCKDVLVRDICKDRDGLLEQLLLECLALLQRADSHLPLKSLLYRLGARLLTL
jgi:hypothetical protein